ncbi:MAG TPA: alpha/beta hydrolase [Candidatus Gallacutalibacter stercoravium]|nr:alpha/beta hydrolase [Candidatus Gallacutalibacter stercoravium]
MKEYEEAYRQAGLRLEEGVVYHEVDGCQLCLDLLYCPGPLSCQNGAAQAPLKPILLWIHGGAWSGLDRNCRPEESLITLAKAGFLVASADYRLMQQSPFPAQIQDCQAAVDWLRANALRYHADAARVGVWGESAGGHLCALLGLSGGSDIFSPGKVFSPVAAVCDWYGPSDFLHDYDYEAQPDLLTLIKNLLTTKPLPLQELASLAAWASPVTHVKEGAPPFLIMHGTTDDLVPIAQSQRLYQALKEKGVAVQYQAIQGQGHGFFKTQEPFDTVIRFFISTLLSDKAVHSAEREA